MDVMTLTAKLVLDTSEYDKAMDKVGKSTDSAEKAMSSAGQKAVSFGSLLKANLASNAISSAISGVANGVKAVGSAVLGVGKSVADIAIQGGMERALNTEQALFKLKGLHMEEQQIEEVMKNANAAVLDTAYGLDEMATVAASAVAAGIQPGEDLERTLKLVGDAAAIAGRDVGSMGAIFNKIAASGKIQGDELNQLTDAGIPILQLLGDVLDEDAEGVRKLAKDGSIGFEEFQMAIEKGMGGAALSMGETFSGNLANMKAAIKRMGQGILEPFLQDLTPALGNIKQIFNAINKGTTEGLDETITELKQNLSKALLGLFDNLDILFNKMFPVLEEVFEQLFPVLEGIGQKIAVVLQDLLPKLVPVITSLIQGLIPVIINLLPVLIDAGGQIISGIAQGISENADSIGQSLLNLGSQLAGFVLDMMTEAASAINDFDWAGTASEIAAFLKDALTGDGMSQFIEAASEIIGGLASGLGEALPELIPAALEIIYSLLDELLNNIDALIQGAIDLLTGFAQGLIDAIPIIVEKGPEILIGIVDAIINNLPMLLEAAVELMLQLGVALIENIPEMVKAIPEIIGALVAGLIELVGDLFEAGAELIGSLKEGIFSFDFAQWGKDLINNFVGGIKSAGGAIKEAAEDAANKIASFLHFSEPDEGPLSDFHTYGPDMMQLLADGISQNNGSVIAAVQDIATQLQTVITENLATVSESMSMAVQTTIETLINFFSELPTKIADILSQFLSKVYDFGNQLRRKATEIGKGFATTLINALKDLPNQFVKIGENVVQGLWKGIQSGWSWLTDRVRELSRSLMNAAKEALGIASPSKEFKWIGQMIDEGLALGISQYADKAVKAIDNLIYFPDVSQLLGGRTNEGDELSTNGFVQYLTVNAPTELDPSEVARQTRNANREMMLNLRLA